MGAFLALAISYVAVLQKFSLFSGVSLHYPDNVYNFYSLFKVLMKNKSLPLKIFGSLLMITSLTFVMTSCYVPSEIRHKNINNFLEQINIDTMDNIISKETDSGGGVSSGSWVQIQFEGYQTFDVLFDKITKVSNINCSPIGTHRQLDCKLEQLDINLSGNNPVYLTINDYSNGK